MATRIKHAASLLRFGINCIFGGDIDKLQAMAATITRHFIVRQQKGDSLTKGYRARYPKVYYIWIFVLQINR